MKIDSEAIIVRKRIRKNLGDLKPLMESIRKNGLLNPIVINKKNELIAGQRRLESCKQLDLKSVEVTVVDKESKLGMLEMELEENTQRQNLNADELADAYLQIEQLRNPSIFRRIWNAITRFFKRLFRIK